MTDQAEATQAQLAENGSIDFSKAKQFQIHANLYHWDETLINGEPDVFGAQIPGRDGDHWTVNINLDDSRVENWPAGIEAQIKYNVSAASKFRLLDANKQILCVYAASHPPCFLQDKNDTKRYITQLHISTEGIATFTESRLQLAKIDLDLTAQTWSSQQHDFYDNVYEPKMRITAKGIKPEEKESLLNYGRELMANWSRKDLTQPHLDSLVLFLKSSFDNGLMERPLAVHYGLYSSSNQFEAAPACRKDACECSADSDTDIATEYTPESWLWNLYLDAKDRQRNLRNVFRECVGINLNSPRGCPLEELMLLAFEKSIYYHVHEKEIITLQGTREAFKAWGQKFNLNFDHSDDSAESIEYRSSITDSLWTTWCRGYRYTVMLRTIDRSQPLLDTKLEEVYYRQLIDDEKPTP